MNPFSLFIWQNQRKMFNTFLDLTWLNSIVFTCVLTFIFSLAAVCVWTCLISCLIPLNTEIKRKIHFKTVTMYYYNVSTREQQSFFCKKQHDNILAQHRHGNKSHIIHIMNGAEATTQMWIHFLWLNCVRARWGGLWPQSMQLLLYYSDWGTN